MHSSNENYQAKRTALVLAPSTTTESIDGATAAYQAETDSQSVLLKWFAALKQILPIYLSIHLAFLILTYGSALFSIGNFSPKTLPISTLWLAWYRWDSGHFTAIASNGYDAAWRTAFFPLFPLLERGVAFLTHDPFIAGPDHLKPGWPGDARGPLPPRARRLRRATCISHCTLSFGVSDSLFLRGSLQRVTLSGADLAQFLSYASWKLVAGGSFWVAGEFDTFSRACVVPAFLLRISAAAPLQQQKHSFRQYEQSWHSCRSRNIRAALLLPISRSAVILACVSILGSPSTWPVARVDRFVYDHSPPWYAKLRLDP